MATPSAGRPVGKRSVALRPVHVRTAHPSSPLLTQPVAPAEAVAMPGRVNWQVVGLAAGVAAAVVLGVILFCALAGRSRARAEEAVGAAEVVVAETVPTPGPEPSAGLAPPAPEPPLPQLMPRQPPPPAAAEPGTAKPAGSAPPSGVLPGPGPAAFAKGYAEPHHFRFVRRDHQSADELSRQLLAVPEVDLDHEAGASAFVVDLAAHPGKSTLRHPVLVPLLKRADLHGLPLAMGTDCQLGKESAQNLQVLSRKLRQHLSASLPKDGTDTRINAGVLRSQLSGWCDEDALPTLVQMLQAEDRPVRLYLVELLRHIKGPTATSALVQRALFDLAADVREGAVRALVKRPRDEYRSLLLDGLRYPWPAAADHAAEALVALDERDAVPELTALVLASDPVAPARRMYRPVDPVDLRTSPKVKDALAETVVAIDERRGPLQLTTHLAEPSDIARAVRAGPSAVYTMREMVRINHLRNCLLCHAPATSPNDPVRGLVPTPGQPLPPPFTTPYYEGQNGLFVRTDITYIRQDFSVPQPVARAGNWPAHQRYDYVVRTRYPSKEELRREPPATFPQREAVRRALRELGAVKEEQGGR